jgi:hypothetical protein
MAMIADKLIFIAIDTCNRLLLSQELIDIIVDYAHDDFDILLNCSLASRLFLPSSRLHLFEQLELRSSRWAEFFDLLDSPLSTITHVWSIKLDFEDKTPDLPSIMTLLHDLGLHSITLDKMRIEQPINLDWEIVELVGLRKLSITCGDFPDPSHMFDIISRFKTVEHLSLHCCSFHRLNGLTDIHLPIHNFTAPFWRIIELHGEWDDPYEIFTWLTMQPDITALETVVLTRFEPEDFITAGNFLRALGPQLKYLELQLTSTVLGMSSLLHSCIPEITHLVSRSILC